MSNFVGPFVYTAIKDVTATIGLHKISGVVTENGVPVRREVRAFTMVGSVYLGRTFSDPTTGYYELLNIPPGNCFVIAFDVSKTFDPVAADDVTPVAM